MTFKFKKLKMRQNLYKKKWTSFMKMHKENKKRIYVNLKEYMINIMRMKQKMNQGNVVYQFKIIKYKNQKFQ